jgi:hypothetical protein
MSHASPQQVILKKIICAPLYRWYPWCCSLFLDLLLQSGRINSRGAVAELADAEDLKSSDGDILWVQVPPALPENRAPSARFSFHNNVLDLSKINMRDPRGIAGETTTGSPGVESSEFA